MQASEFPVPPFSHLIKKDVVLGVHHSDTSSALHDPTFLPVHILAFPFSMFLRQVFD